MSRGKLRDHRRRYTPAQLIRASTPDALKEWLSSLYKGTDSTKHEEWVGRKTMNRAARRSFARSTRKRGRGYTTTAATIKPRPLTPAMVRYMGARGLKFKPRREKVS